MELAPLAWLHPHSRVWLVISKCTQFDITDYHLSIPNFVIWWINNFIRPFLVDHGVFWLYNCVVLRFLLLFDWVNLLKLLFDTVDLVLQSEVVVELQFIAFVYVEEQMVEKSNESVFAVSKFCNLVVTTRNRLLLFFLFRVDNICERIGSFSAYWAKWNIVRGVAVWLIWYSTDLSFLVRVRAVVTAKFTMVVWLLLTFVILFR